MLHTYEIVIPAAQIPEKMVREMIGSPSYCPIATHFRNRGYAVLVGGFDIVFFPHDIPATIDNWEKGWKVDLDSDYWGILYACAEAEEDFHFPIDLPEEILNAVPGASPWRRKL